MTAKTWDEIYGDKAPQTPLAAVKAFVPDLTDDELRKLAREKLSEALQAIDAVEQPGMTLKLCAEVKDRLDGRPTQAMTVDQNLNVVNVHATIRYVRAGVDILENGVVDKPQVIDN